MKEGESWPGLDKIVSACGAIGVRELDLTGGSTDFPGPHSSPTTTADGYGPAGQKCTACYEHLREEHGAFFDSLDEVGKGLLEEAVLLNHDFNWDEQRCTAIELLRTKYGVTADNIE